MLGLVEHYILRYSFVFDHFQYLASMGVMALVGAGAVQLTGRFISGQPGLQSFLFAGILLALGTFSWHRAWVFENEETLWTDTLSKNQTCWLGHNNLGVALAQKGEADKAIEHFRKALAINPDYAETCCNIGNALLQKWQVDDAITHYQAALRINPNYALGHVDLGLALIRKRQMNDAMDQFRQAIKIDPTCYSAYSNLGNILLEKGQANEAITQFQTALRLNPADGNAQNNLARAQALKQ